MELVRGQFPLGSGTADSCLCQEDQNTITLGNTGVTVWKYCVGSQTVNMRSIN